MASKYSRSRREDSRVMFLHEFLNNWRASKKLYPDDSLDIKEEYKKDKNYVKILQQKENETL